VLTSEYVQSRYTITTPLHGGRTLAYNSLSGALAVWEAHERTAYDDQADGHTGADVQATRDLVYGGFLVRREVDELEVLRQQYNNHRYDMSTMILTVAPTLACNFGCDYCFQGQDKPTGGMTPEVQDALLAMIGRVTPAIRRMHVAWYGGEPLIRKDLIASLSDRIIAHADAHRLVYDAMIVTNGYFLDVETARMLAARRVKAAQVTLDGLPSYHDVRRHLHSKKGTFARIVDNLRDVVQAVPELRLSVRVNIDERNYEDIAGLIDLLAEQGLGGRDNLKMYFAPVEAMTEGCHGVTDVTLTKSRYAELETDLYRRGFQAKLTALPYPPRFHGTCAAVRPRGFVIVPSGDIHKCWDTVSDPSRQGRHPVRPSTRSTRTRSATRGSSGPRSPTRPAATARSCRTAPARAPTSSSTPARSAARRPCCRAPAGSTTCASACSCAPSRWARCAPRTSTSSARAPTPRPCAPRSTSTAGARCRTRCGRCTPRSPARRPGASRS
jgi:uncharacterized protein